MMGFISLLGNKYVWLIIVVGGIVAGVWFKINGLEKDVAKAEKALAMQVEANDVLTSNNATLKQNLNLALSVNDANAQLIDEIKRDQNLAATSLKRLSSDLSASKATLGEARARLASSTLPLNPVPQRIVETIVTIQDTRTAQAALNKQAEGELR
jgi:hypothetical protein